MDKLEKLPPIPTPVSVIWREFRIQILPIAVFILTVAGCVLLWRDVGTGNQLPGIGEGVRSIVASPQIGLLRELQVEPYQWVEAGQSLATLLPVDPRGKLDLLQSELQIARLRMEPSLADQNAMNFEQVRIDQLRLKQEIAVARVGLQQSEKVLKRNAVLFKEKLVSEDLYDLSLRDRDIYQAEVDEKSKALAEIEARMVQLRSVGEPQSPGANHPMLELVARLEAQLLSVQTNWAPIILTAPISGMVQLVYRQTGEFVTEGEPLITINSPRSERVIGYLRQPYTMEVEVGRKVEVSTRTRQRQKFVSEISRIGAQVETITNALAFIRQGSLVDVGLPIVIDVPAQVNIRPGELVDIAFPRTASPPVPKTAQARP